MKVTHLGHSCLLVDTGRTRVLIDPGTFSAFDEVSGLDAVLVTHQHPDHLDPARVDGLLARSPQAVLRTDPGTAAGLRERGLEVAENVAGEDVTVGDLAVRPVGRLHAVIHEDLPRVENVGLVLEAGGTTLFHPGDALDADPGPVDHLAVPLSAPWCALKETVELVRRVAPAAGIVPIHDGLLADAGRELYLRQVAGLGLQGGGEVLDLRGAGPTELG